MKALALTSILLLTLGGIVFSQPIPTDSMYLGQTPPGITREIFNLTTDPGFFAGEKIAISPDGKEIYYEVVNSNWSSFKFKYYKYTNNQWNGPIDLFNNYYCLSLSPDGNVLNFENNNYNDSWISSRQDSVWSPPLRFLTNFDVHSLNLTSNGNYYLSSNISGGMGQRDICKIIIENSDTTLVGLGLPLNSSALDGDFFMSNDESFIILMSKRTGGFGLADLYLSFKRSDGTWTNPKNLGTSINTSNDDFSPYVTTDNKYLFYESGYSSPSSIYWVRIDSLIDSLMHTNYNPYVNNLIPNQTDTIGHPFNYTIPDSTFIDDDGNNTLTFTATLTNGNPLPTWLAFDSLSYHFSGIPTTVQTVNIKVTVTDTAGSTASTSFRISIIAASAIEQLGAQNDEIEISPNPTTGIIQISLNAITDKNTIVEVSNQNGQIVYKGSFLKKTSFDLSNNPKGMYLVKLNIDHKTAVRKIYLE